MNKKRIFPIASIYPKAIK